MSTAKDATDGYKMAQTSPMAAATKATAADAPAGGRHGAQRDPIDEGRRGLGRARGYGRCSRRSGLRESREGQGRRRARLPPPMGRVVERRAAGRSAGGEKEATLACLQTPPDWSNLLLYM